MRKLVILMFLFGIFSCNNFVDRPKNLVDKDKMAEVIAELALNDQVIIINPTASNTESGTRFILKKYGISAKDFSDSYEYYSITKEMENIIADSQQILLKKYPETEDFINKKLKENPGLPEFAR